MANWKQFNKISMSYLRGKLTAQNMLEDPLEQFSSWVKEAVDSQILMPNAFTLATVSAEGAPDARIVLLMKFDAEGFVFFTNYQSAKAQHLANNTRATMLFFWPELERQIRVSGEVSKTKLQYNDDYFASRPREAQIAAIISPQSQPIANYRFLTERAEDLKIRYGDHDKIPRPDNWGGYCLMARKYEFWQGGPNRLHDRFQYSKKDEGDWEMERIAP